MPTDRELLQMALDALEYCDDQEELFAREALAIEALRARLAQPEPEQPTAEEYKKLAEFPPIQVTRTQECKWAGLSTAETKVLWNLTKKPREYAEMIEAKLKERNT